MKKVNLTQQLGIMRARIEAEFEAPSVLAVTSATAGDGKTVVTRGLACNLAGAGHRVLFVDGADSRPSSDARSAPRLSTHGDFDILNYVTSMSTQLPDRLTINADKIVDSCTIESVRATYARLRERYEYIIVDTSPAVRSAAGLIFTTCADLVLIAFRQGRAAGKADRDLVTLLQSNRANVAGVITVGSGMRNAFADAFGPVESVRSSGGGLSSIEDAVAVKTSSRVVAN